MALTHAGSRSLSLVPLARAMPRQNHLFPAVKKVSSSLLLSERYRLEQFGSLLFDPQQVTAHRDRVEQIVGGRPQQVA